MVLKKFANIVLSGLMVTALVLFCVLIARHGWSIHYLLVLAFAGMTGASLALPIHSRINLALFLCSLILSSYFAEALLAVKAATWRFSLTDTRSFPIAFGDNESTVGLQAAIASKHHTTFDTRSKLSVVMDLRQRGLDAWPQIPAEALYDEWPTGSADPAVQIDGVGVMPLGGIANKLTVYCNENGNYTLYTSDEHGFHNPAGLWDLSKSDIAAVGDSFVLGGCVPSDKNFVALLRQQFPWTINVGRAGNGPLSELGSIKEYLTIVKPKIIFWFYFEENDLGVDLPLEKRNPVLRQYLTRGFTQGLFAKQAAIDDSLTAYVEAARESQSLQGHLRQVMQLVDAGAAVEHAERLMKLTNFRKALMTVLRPGNRHSEHDAELQAPAPDEDLGLFHDVLEEAQQSVLAWGGTMVFVYLPQFERYVDVKYASQDRDRVIEVARSLNMPVIDMHLVFASFPDSLSLFPLRLRGHYTEAGHRLVAEQLVTFASNRLKLGALTHRGRKKPRMTEETGRLS